MTLRAEHLDALHKLPPYAVEAEFAVLGALLSDPERLAKARDVLPDGSWFMRPANAALYNAMLHVAGQNQGACDIVLLNQYLEDTGEIKLVGGLDYLVQCATSFPSAAHVVHYARLVREKHLLFKALVVAGDLVFNLHQRPDLYREHLTHAINELLNIQHETTKFAAPIGGVPAPEARTIQSHGTPTHVKVGSQDAA